MVLSSFLDERHSSAAEASLLLAAGRGVVGVAGAAVVVRASCRRQTITSTCLTLQCFSLTVRVGVVVAAIRVAVVVAVGVAGRRTVVARAVVVALCNSQPRSDNVGGRHARDLPASWCRWR